MVFHGFSWVFTVFHGFSWFFRGFQNFSWFFMVFMVLQKVVKKLFRDMTLKNYKTLEHFAPNSARINLTILRHQLDPAGPGLDA